METFHLIKENGTLESCFFTHLISKDDYGRHMHDYFEIVYITEGTAEHELNKKTTFLSTGDVAIIPPYMSHCWKRNSDSFFTHRDLIVSADLFYEICNFVSPDFYSEYVTKYCSKFSISKSSLQFFENIFSQYGFENGWKGQNDPEYISLAKTTLASLLSNIIKISKKEYPKWLDSLLERMHNPKSIKLGLSEILADTNYNRIYICRVFKKHLGKTITEYYNDIRLDYARLYLISTTKTIVSICNELNFSSYTYFYKVFKQRFGILPQQYRTLHYI